MGILEQAHSIKVASYRLFGSLILILLHYSIFNISFVCGVISNY
jgi:hypothetical protein